MDYVDVFKKLDWRDLWHTEQKSLFLCDYWTKSDGVFAEMQIIRTSVRILKHIQINLTISKAIDAESLTVIFLGQALCEW